MTYMEGDPERVASGRRIDDLLSDLGGQLEAAEAAELVAEVEDRTRRESALLAVVDRLRGSMGRSLSVRTCHGALTGVLLEVGPDWLQMALPAGRSALIRLPEVLAVSGLATSSVPAGSLGPVANRLDIRHVLRAAMRDRRRVQVLVAHGPAYAGVLNRCGADFIELSALGTSGDSEPAAQTWLLPVHAIVTVLLE